MDLKPTLADLRAVAPDLETFFRDLDPLIEASKKGMPAARETIEGAEPLLAEIHPFLEQLNPMLQYLELSQLQVSDFISYGGGGAGRHDGLAGRRHRPLPAPVRPAGRRERGDLPRAHEHQPRLDLRRP